MKLKILKSYDSDAKIKAHNFLLECSAKRLRLATETLMEEFKAVVCKKVDFENRDKSKLTDFLGNSRRSEI